MFCGVSCGTAKALRAADVQGTEAGLLLWLPWNPEAPDWGGRRDLGERTNVGNGNKR